MEAELIRYTWWLYLPTASLCKLHSLMNTDIRNELNNSDADAPKQLSQ